MDNSAYKEVLITGAHSLMERYNPATGLIKSWDFNKEVWQYPVIIDNMMNLEFFTWAARVTGDDAFDKAARSHANKTMEHHFRPDFSTWHVVSYDTVTGNPHIKQTQQGYADKSAWARGQAWGLYGYTMMYRETGDKAYLNQARNVAYFIMSHPNLPEDKVPYWDFNAPDIPDALRDVSAAAVISSALIELSGFDTTDFGKQCLTFAEQQIRSLSSPAYLAESGTNGYFTLKHSVGSLPGNSEVDVPLTYADYYYVEALLRLKKLNR
ncbi:Unsaturated glucuronyl hydrolase [Bacteroidales bacterium Barb4]|nr:Unsaturated glucuronyl hydrolase [Bacteroidales bacterium Barb4]